MASFFGPEIAEPFGVTSERHISGSLDKIMANLGPTFDWTFSRVRFLSFRGQGQGRLLQMTLTFEGRLDD